MKKSFFFCALFFFTISFLFSNILTAQFVQLDWIKKIGGDFTDLTRSMMIDEFGNVYLTGRFEGTVDFDPEVEIFNLTAIGNTDLYIVKLDTYGSFIWAKNIGGLTTTSIVGRSIKIDDNGYCYITGEFDGTPDFDPSSDIYNLSSSGYHDAFILKLDPLGNFIWVKKVGGEIQEYGRSIDIDTYGNVYATGYFQGTADFDPGSGVYNLSSTASSFDLFILKLNNNGDFIWAKKIGGVVFDFCNSTVIDQFGNIYITGWFGDLVDFDPNLSIYNLLSEGSDDVYISKLDSSGNFVWAKKVGGIYVDQGISVVVDILNNVYVSGSFNGTVDFDPNAGEFYLASIGSWDNFILKLDSLGNLIWAKQQYGGVENGKGHKINLDIYGNVYTTGAFNGVGDFDPGIETYNLTSIGGDDAYISKLDSSGNFVWAKQLSGIYSEWGNEIVIDSFGNIYTSGDFQGTVDFDPNDGIFNLTSAGDYDIFIHKLSQNLSSYIYSSPISCYGAEDGAAWVSTFNGTPPYTYLWSPGGSTNDTIFNLGAGTYFVTITDSIGTTVVDSLVILQPNLLTVSIETPVDTVCLGNSIDLTAIASGGTFPYNYVWSTSSLDTLALNNATLNISQYVSAVATDLNNCMVQDSIFITVQNPPLLISSADTCICLGGIATLTASGIPTYLWNTGDTTSVISVSPNITSNYIVSYNDGICSASDITLVCVNPNPFVMASEDTSMAYNSSVLLEAFGDSPFYWSPANSLSCNPCSNPIASPENSTSYLVTVTNEFGCSAQDTVTIEVYYYQLVIPNVITPNQDGLNDTFYIIGLPEKTILSIFNRWGNEIFSSISYQNDWKTFTDGVYYYILNTPDGKSYNGSVQVNGN